MYFDVFVICSVMNTFFRLTWLHTHGTLLLIRSQHFVMFVERLYQVSTNYQNWNSSKYKIELDIWKAIDFGFFSCLIEFQNTIIFSGVTSTGYSCGICKVKAHKSCVSNIVVGCKWNTLNSIEEKSYTFENVSSICHHDIINFWSPIPLLVTFSKKVPKSFSHSLRYEIFSALFNVLPFGVFGLKLSYVAQIF